MILSGHQVLGGPGMPVILLAPYGLVGGGEDPPLAVGKHSPRRIRPEEEGILSPTAVPAGMRATRIAN